MQCNFDCGKICTILMTKNCVGCKFMKTADEFKEANDRAIDRCRRLGLCDKCEYASKKCVKSDGR